MGQLKRILTCKDCGIKFQEDVIVFETSGEKFIGNSFNVLVFKKKQCKDCGSENVEEVKG